MPRTGLRTSIPLQHLNLHGHDIGYRLAGPGGDAPVVVLVHGMAGSSTTWRPVMPALAEDYNVLAPDLLGHGQTAKPRGDYSLGNQASLIRDLMVALGIERATFVGHSLGGGIAMQLAYQFPERAERLVLVASGGLGREVSPFLRAVSLPGAEYVMPPILNPTINRVAGEVGGALLKRLGLRLGTTETEVWRSYTTLTDLRANSAFVHTVRAVIDVRGQRVSARDRLYLAAEVPTMIVWGAKDRIIPVDHARWAHDAIPGSRLEIHEETGHFLPFEQPEWFYDVLADFLGTVPPAHADDGRFRTRLLARQG